MRFHVAAYIIINLFCLFKCEKNWSQEKEVFKEPFLFIQQAAAEDFIFYPSNECKKQANMQSLDLFKEAAADRELFWGKQADCLSWSKPWTKILEWNPPYAQWFIGGKLNTCYNCVDRHLYNGNRTKTAIIWEGERGDQRLLTYEQLYEEVNQCASALKACGVKKGDTVAIYMPMIPEAAVGMLACARIGAVHTVVFGGFSSEALKDRIIDAEAKVVLTADGGFRRGKIVPLKETVDAALIKCPDVQKVIVVKHAGQVVHMEEERDHWYHELTEHINQSSIDNSPEEMDAEDPLYILYTSGTTGKPKGIVHTTGGYMVGVTSTTRWVFDIKPDDVYWCTADIGWVSGHSYVVYGPLANGMTTVLYEGTADWPEKDRFWKIIEKYKITILYTAPTAIRTFMKWGKEWIKENQISSLRVLGSVGEPINPEAWIWYFKHIGQERCPIVDTWWQTETGCIMIAPIPGITTLKPGSATHPLPGIDVAVIKEEGKAGEAGILAITSPWPSMLRGIYKDPQRYEETYWKKWNNGFYFTGDAVKQDEDRYLWLMGRIDDVMNVSGHRIGTMEIESALVEDASVAEAAVIGIDHEVKGQAIIAFVILKDSFLTEPCLEERLKQQVVQSIGTFARPEKIIFIGDLPKTRSGKIMRRLLRDIAEGRVLGDSTTLADPLVIHELKEKYTED
jgi:acetyl-CoA synthetase